MRDSTRLDLCEVHDSRHGTSARQLDDGLEVTPLALEPTVLVAGRRVSIKIGAQGKTAWREGELDALVRDFRS